MALKIAHYGYVMENGKIVMEGTSEMLTSNPDVKEFLSYEMEEHLTLNNNNNNINNNNNAKRIAQPVLPSSAVSQNPRIDKVREASLKSWDA